MRDRDRSCFSVVSIFAFFLLLIVLGGWFTVPFLAERHFGEPDASLTGFDRWNFSRQILAGRTDLLSSVSSVGDEQKFTISSGESVSSVAARLEEVGLINDAKAFRAYLVYKGLDSSIKAGKFKLSASQTSLEIIGAIQSLYSAVVPFYVYPGWRAEEIAAALPTSGIRRKTACCRRTHRPSSSSKSHGPLSPQPTSRVTSSMSSDWMPAALRPMPSMSAATPMPAASLFSGQRPVLA